jgi:hypothetical protein
MQWRCQQDEDECGRFPAAGVKDAGAVFTREDWQVTGDQAKPSAAETGVNC